MGIDNSNFSPFCITRAGVGAPIFFFFPSFGLSNSGRVYFFFKNALFYYFVAFNFVSFYVLGLTEDRHVLTHPIVIPVLLGDIVDDSHPPTGGGQAGHLLFAL